jgi:hypothetical protein
MTSSLTCSTRWPMPGQPRPEGRLAAWAPGSDAEYLRTRRDEAAAFS